jgi:hypothetical protein
MGECEEEKGEEKRRIDRTARERERKKMKWETDAEVSIIITGYQPCFLFFFTCPQGQKRVISLSLPSNRPRLKVIPPTRDISRL